MSVVREISIQVVEKELENCIESGQLYGWEISAIDQESMKFNVKMESKIDGEVFILEIQFDNYPELPLLLDFIDPLTGQKGTKKAYPRTDKGFFHAKGPTICHPASRKAYNGFQGLHNEWDMVGWQKNPSVGTLTNLNAILQSIYFRINNKNLYRGRMEK